MIVCICNNVSEKDIRLAVEDGMTTVSELRANLDVGTCCGKCVSCARRVLRESMDNTGSAPKNHVMHIQPMHFQADTVTG